jgi:xylulokinase
MEREAALGEDPRALEHARSMREHELGVMRRADAVIVHSTAEQALLAELPDEPAAPRGVYFLPYLSGERTPHNDPHAVAIFHGLTTSMGRADLVQAVLEGVAFAFRDGVDAIRATGTVFDRLTLIGGGARSRYWAQVLADVLELPLELRAGAEVGPAFGAARLARLAATGEDPAVVCREPALLQTVVPCQARVELYRQARPLFRELYLQQRRGVTGP